MIYVTWTGDDGQRELRTFANGQAGSGRLMRWLRNRGIAFEWGACADSPRGGYTPTAPREGRAWRADPRVYRPAGGPR